MRRIAKPDGEVFSQHMFVAVSSVADAPLELNQVAAQRIADRIGPGATWRRGQRAVVCTADPARVDVDVSTTDDGSVTAVFGDAYLDEEPLDASTFRGLDGAYERINGEFAGVTETEDGLSVVTDRLNLRQLFAYREESHFVASTSVQAVLVYLAARGVADTVSLNRTALTEFADFGHLLGHKTHIEGIDLLPAATVVAVAARGTSLTYQERTYWEYGYGSYFTSRMEAVDALTEAFQAAVALRSTPGLRLGLHLSGGMDSRLILAATPPEADLTAYTFGVRYNDEATIARLAARAVGRPVEYLPLENTLTEYAGHATSITDGHASIRHFHHIPTMDALVGRCDKLFLGTSLDVFLGGSKIDSRLRDGMFDATDLYEKTTHFDDDLWNAVFEGDGYFDAATARTSLTDSFERLCRPGDDLANACDTWNLRNRQARFIFQAGARSINYYLPVSNPLADSCVIDVWCRLPPRMRFESDLRVAMLRALAPRLALVPLGGTWAPPVVPQLRYGPGAIRMLLNSREVRSRLPGVNPARPFGYPDYGEWLRDERSAVFVSAALASFASRGWADGERLAAAYDAHRRGDVDVHEELCLLVTLELWLQRLGELAPEILGRYTQTTTPTTEADVDGQSVTGSDTVQSAVRSD